MGQETGCNLRMVNPSYSLAVFHDEGYKESDVDVEIQIAVQGEHKNTENVIFKTVEPILMASAVLQGILRPDQRNKRSGCYMGY